jgi:hypothetical protein
MAADTKITGVRIIIELDDSGEWSDLTPYLDEEAAEAVEQLLDNIEDAMNMDIQAAKHGGYH